MELTNRCLKLHVFRFVQTMTLKKNLKKMKKRKDRKEKNEKEKNKKK